MERILKTLLYELSKEQNSYKEIVDRVNECLEEIDDCKTSYDDLRRRYIGIFESVLDCFDEKISNVALHGFQNVIKFGETQCQQTSSKDKKFSLQILSVISRSIPKYHNSSKIMAAEIISHMVELYPHHFEIGQIIKAFRLLCQSYDLTNDSDVRRAIKTNVSSIFLSYTTYISNDSKDRDCSKMHNTITMTMVYLAEDCNFYAINSSRSALPCVYEAILSLSHALPTGYPCSTQFIDALWKDVCPSLISLFGASADSSKQTPLSPQPQNVRLKVGLKDNTDTVVLFDHKPCRLLFDRPEYQETVCALVCQIVKLAGRHSSVRMVLGSLFQKALFVLSQDATFKGLGVFLHKCLLKIVENPEYLLNVIGPSHYAIDSCTPEIYILDMFINCCRLCAESNNSVLLSYAFMIVNALINSLSLIYNGKWPVDNPNMENRTNGFDNNEEDLSSVEVSSYHSVSSEDEYSIGNSIENDFEQFDVISSDEDVGVKDIFDFREISLNERQKSESAQNIHGSTLLTQQQNDGMDATPSLQSASTLIDEFFEQFNQTLLNSMLVKVRSCIEVDAKILQFCSKFCQDHQNNGEGFFNADFLYMTIYKALHLNAKLRSRSHYQQEILDHNFSPSLAEFTQSFYSHNFKLIFPGAWIGQIYRHVISNDILANTYNQAITNLIRDIDNSGEHALNTHYLTDYQALHHPHTLLHSADERSSKGRKLVQNLLATCCESLGRKECKNFTQTNILDKIIGILAKNELIFDASAKLSLKYLLDFKKTFSYDKMLKHANTLKNLLTHHPDGQSLNLSISCMESLITLTGITSQTGMYQQSLKLMNILGEQAANSWNIILLCTMPLSGLHVKDFAKHIFASTYTLPICTLCFTEAATHDPNLWKIIFKCYGTINYILHYLNLEADLISSPISNTLCWISGYQKADTQVLSDYYTKMYAGEMAGDDVKFKEYYFKVFTNVVPETSEYIATEIQPNISILGTLIPVHYLHSHEVFKRCAQNLNFVSLSHMIECLIEYNITKLEELNVLLRVYFTLSKTTETGCKFYQMMDQKTLKCLLTIQIRHIRDNFILLKDLYVVCIGSGRPMLHLIGLWARHIKPHLVKSLGYGYHDITLVLIDTIYQLTNSLIQSHEEFFRFNFNESIVDVYREILLATPDTNLWKATDVPTKSYGYKILNYMAGIASNNLNDLKSGWKSLISATKIALQSLGDSCHKPSCAVECAPLCDIFKIFVTIRDDKVYATYAMEVVDLLVKLQAIYQTKTQVENQGVIVPTLKAAIERYFSLPSYALNVDENKKTSSQNCLEEDFVIARDRTLTFEHLFNTVRYTEYAHLKETLDDFEDIIPKGIYSDFPTLLHFPSPPSLTNGKCGEQSNSQVKTLTDLRIVFDILISAITNKSRDILSNSRFASKNDLVHLILALLRDLVQSDRKLLKLRGICGDSAKQFYALYIIHHLIPTLSQYFSKAALSTTSAAKFHCSKDVLYFVGSLTHTLVELLLNFASHFDGIPYNSYHLGMGIYRSIVILYLDMIATNDQDSARLAISSYKYVAQRLVKHPDCKVGDVEIMVETLNLAFCLASIPLCKFMLAFKSGSWNMKGGDTRATVSLGIKKTHSTNGEHVGVSDERDCLKDRLLAQEIFLIGEEILGPLSTTLAKPQNFQRNNGKDNVISLHISYPLEQNKIAIHDSVISIKDSVVSAMSIYLITQCIGDIVASECQFMSSDFVSFIDDRLFQTNLYKTLNEQEVKKPPTAISLPSQKSIMDQQIACKIMDLLSKIYHFSSAFDRRPGMKLLFKRCLNWDEDCLPCLYRINLASCFYYGVFLMDIVLKYKVIGEIDELKGNSTNETPCSHKNYQTFLKKLKEYFRSLFAFYSEMDSAAYRNPVDYESDCPPLEYNNQIMIAKKCEERKSFVNQHPTFASVFNNINSKAPSFIARRAFLKPGASLGSIDRQQQSHKSLPSTPSYERDFSVHLPKTTDFSSENTLIADHKTAAVSTIKRNSLIDGCIFSLEKDSKVHKQIWSNLVIKSLQLILEEMTAVQAKTIINIIQPEIKCFELQLKTKQTPQKTDSHSMMICHFVEQLLHKIK